MQTHLIEAVDELKEEGKVEQEAISIAINRFGDGKQITKGLLGLFKAQNKVVKNLYRLAFIFLIIGIGLFIGLMVRDQLVGDEQLKVQDTLNTIIDKPGDRELTETEKNQIISKFKEVTNDKLTYFALYKRPDGSPDYVDRENFPQEYSKMQEVISYGNIREWYFSNENKNWYAEVGYNGSQTLGTFYAIPFSFLIIFVILGIVALILKHHSQRKILSIFLKD